MDTQNARQRKRALLGLVCLLGGIGTLIWYYASHPAQVAQPTEPAATIEPAPAPETVAAPPPLPVAVSPLEEKWGIQVVSVLLTNEATSVQVRYKVVSPEKVMFLAETNANAYLVNEGNGAILPMVTAPAEGTVPQGASLRTTRRMMRQAGRFPPPPNRLIAGETYLLEIPNWGRSLQSGSRVSLVVNEFRQEGLTVE